jgi:glycosyltransferase involved in cell wall biosynthesis
MRILQVVPYFPPYMGGQERFVYNLSKHLVKLGHDVSIITSNFPKTIPLEQVDGCTVKRHVVQVRMLRNPISIGAIYQVLNEYDDYDVVHCHNEHAFSTMTTAVASKIDSFPLVLSCHGRLNFGVSGKDRITQLYDRAIGSKIMNSVDALVFLSDIEKKFFENYQNIKKRTYSIPNAVDTEELKGSIDNANKSDLKETLLGNKDLMVVLFVGSISHRKGVPVLLNAVKPIVSEFGTNVVFALVGSGDYEVEAKRFVKNNNIEHNVRFLGRISDEMLNKFYQCSDVFVLPSYSEGMPTSILEAMFYQIPVITTNLPSVADRFESTAILITPGSVSELVNGISLVLKDLKAWDHKNKLGKKMVETEYNWNNVAGQYESVYKDII